LIPSQPIGAFGEELGVSAGSRGLAALVGIVAAAALLLGAAGPASAKTKWLCKPGAKPNPCKGSLGTTIYSADGSSRVVTPKNARKPKVDCFYVYPTVSEQEGPNANKDVDPQQTAIAEYQAARFSQRCRVYAPVYRQLTLSAINATEGVPEEAVEKAYGDVLEAWRAYLRKYNRGRGVVLIGHSQGTGMLSELLREEIERKRDQRELLVSALLLGGNVTVRKGEEAGGSFRRTPLCRSARGTGCVIAFSTFGETPPDDAIFGTTDGALVDTHGVDPSKLEVACTSPSRLSGDGNELRTFVRSEPFPGTLGLGLQIMYGGPQPTAPTPWLQPADRFTGGCAHANGAHVLLISPVGDGRKLNPSPTPAWGLHLADANIGLGNLVEVVGKQSRRWLKQSR
jgi:hypothetical protein